jgi:hypothetical protein
MEATSSSETSVSTSATRHNILEDDILDRNVRHREHAKTSSESATSSHRNYLPLLRIWNFCYWDWGPVRVSSFGALASTPPPPCIGPGN